jgi:hypothetical protein
MLEASGLTGRSQNKPGKIQEALHRLAGRYAVPQPYASVHYIPQSVTKNSVQQMSPSSGVSHVGRALLSMVPGAAATEH